MDLRERITTLLSVCLRGAECGVRVEPVADSEPPRVRAYACGPYPGIGAMSSYGMTEADALDGLWESVQREARRSVAMAESTLETVQRTRDSAARNAQELTDRLASLRMAMRSTGARPAVAIASTRPVWATERAAAAGSRAGTGMPAIPASRSTASRKPRFSVSRRKLTASPFAWQPKQ